jgi:type I restriction enzyme S subunit
MESSHYWDQIAIGKVVSTIENFSAGKYQNLSCPNPSLAEQCSIADYLDRETARIDALITKKQRMIELLEEKSRRAIGEMTRQGVNPAAEQVESGLSWVGKIPAHWQVVPNRSTMRIVRRPVTPGREPTLLSLTKRGVIVRDVSENFGKFPATFDNYQIVHAKELVFCLFDIPETPRTVGLSEQIGMVTGAYVVAAAQGGNLPEFIRYLYEGFDDEKSLSLFYTGLRKVIRPDAFMSIRMPLPPEAEQQAIVGELDRLVGSSREAVRLLSKQIDLLRERRQALITAAVTGELEVPGVAA